MAAEGEALNMQDLKEPVSRDAIAPKKITLKSLEGEEFVVSESLAMESRTIAYAISGGYPDNLVLPLPNVPASVLVHIIKYWEMHARLEDEVGDLKKFEKEFVRAFDRDELFQIINAANYLDCSSLLDLTCQTVADAVQEFSVEEAREYFGVENDFTPEEEAAIRRKNEWALTQ